MIINYRQLSGRLRSAHDISCYLEYIVALLITSKPGHLTIVSPRKWNMRITRAQAATHSLESSERSDPHKRSAQLDFLEKIPSERGHAVAPGRQPRRRRSPSAGEIKATKAGSRMKQMMKEDEGKWPR